MNLSRRTFIKSSTIASGGLLLAIHVPGLMRKARAATPSIGPNAWLRIGEDNTITFFCARSEMGQGVHTAMPMLIAEELHVSLAQINLVVAPPNAAYVNPFLTVQATGGSSSIRDGWDKLRLAGAQVRTMLITAAAQKWGVPAAECRAKDGVVHGADGKQATYGELSTAAAQLPVPTDVVLKDPKEFKVIGQRTKRLDTPAKVNGTAEFGLDVKLPGMVYASLEQCPVIGGTVKSFDPAKAQAMPGVVAIVKVTDGIAVVADSFWRATKAREALDITWDRGAGATLSNASMMAGIRQAAATEVSMSIAVKGDVAEAMAGAAKQHRAEYESPLLAHATMEPMNFTADFRDRKCLVIGPTQFQGAQPYVAKAIGLAPEDVSVRTTFLGGGFGRRFEIDFMVQAAEISRAVGRPVKLIWTREDDLRHDYYRPMALHRMAGGLDAEGRPVALTLHLTSQSITQRAFGLPKDVLDPYMKESAVVPYAIPNMKHELIAHDAGLRVGYWRSVSHALNAFANESFIDELAHLAGQDPYAFRLGLLARQPREAAVLQQAAEKAGWGTALPRGRARGIALLKSDYATSLAMVAEVSVQANAVVIHRIVVAVDCGRMVNPDTVEAQVQSGVVFGISAALHGNVTLVEGVVQESNFDNYPVLRMKDTPSIEVVLIASSEPPGGIGEPSTALVAPALANALFAATGRRQRSLPLSPS